MCTASRSCLTGLRGGRGAGHLEKFRASRICRARAFRRASPPYFIDGNKRAAVIATNHTLIAWAGGLLVVPGGEADAFKGMLVRHYEGEGPTAIRAFLGERCWRRLG